MADIRGTPELLRFRGRPNRLGAFVKVDGPLPQVLPARVKLSHDVSLQTRLSGAGGSGMGLARLSLPPETPPGTYEGVLEFGDHEQPIVVEVEEHMRLRAQPSSLTLRGAPGDRVKAELTVANTGNVSCELRGPYVFGVFREDGLEVAIGRSLRTDLAVGERRVDVFAEELARSHGGLVNVEMTEGTGDVAPGETSDLSLVFSLPVDLHRGRSYMGALALHNLRCFIRIDVAGVPGHKEEMMGMGS